MRPTPPCCAPLMHSSIACVRYGRQVQMSEPNTSEPLHSSCTRAVSVTDGSARSRGLPKMYSVWPPIGGRNTSRSLRVTSSGYMPPVSSKSARRRSASDTPKRLATPGSHHTGSIAILVTTPEVSSSSTRPSAASRRNAIPWPTTGPRAAALGAPQWIAGAPLGPWPGWDVRRMCFAPAVPGVSEAMDCFHEPEDEPEAPIGLQAQAHVHIVVQHAVDADGGRFTAVSHEAQRLVERDGRRVGGVRGEVELPDAVGVAGVRDHGLQPAAAEAAAAVRVGDEHAPHEALVLQLAHLLAVPGGQAHEPAAVEGADDRPIRQRH